MRNKKRVLFICTGNSARSQMAEGLASHFFGERWEAKSAGTHPADQVHPLAIQVMAEWGIDISNQFTKSVDEFRDANFDLVVTVCDDAAENCPLWLKQGRVIHIGLPDPAKATGTQEERLNIFRQVRDEIRQRVLSKLDEEIGDEEQPLDQSGKSKSLY